MMTDDEIIAVVTAQKAGKKIQYKRMHGGEWCDCCGRPCWDFYNHDYRVKPEPREWWMNAYNYKEPEMCASREEADRRAWTARQEVIHVREVLQPEGAP